MSYSRVSFRMILSNLQWLSIQWHETSRGLSATVTVELSVKLYYRCDFIRNMWCDLVTPTSVITLLSATTELLQHPGNDVTLQCEFCMDRFHPFANPLVWRKSQWVVDTVEWSTVNVMGVLQEPFSSTGRFDVSFNQSPPNYNFKFKITSKQGRSSNVKWTDVCHVCVVLTR